MGKAAKFLVQKLSISEVITQKPYEGRGGGGTVLLGLNVDDKYTASDICKMIECLVDNIYVRFGRQLFRQTVGIPMGTNCATLLPDLCLFFYENEFSNKLIKEGKKSLLESLISHIVILMTLPLSVIKDLTGGGGGKFYPLLIRLFFTLQA